MAIDTEAKRRAALLEGFVTPDASKGEVWRWNALWRYWMEAPAIGPITDLSDYVFCSFVKEMARRFNRLIRFVSFRRGR